MKLFAFQFLIALPSALLAGAGEHDYHVLTYTAGPGGSIVGESPLTVQHGESGATIFAFADEGALFRQWSDGSLENPRVDEDVSEDLTVTAHFRSLGGVNIDWYYGHGIMPAEGENWSHLDSIDWMGKGMTLREEFIAGTDPNDSLSRFKAEAPMMGEDGEITLRWSSVDGRNYGVEWGHDLENWQELESAPGVPLMIAAAEGAGHTEATLTDPSTDPGSPVFFRVKIPVAVDYDAPIGQVASFHFNDSLENAMGAGSPLEHISASNVFATETVQNENRRVLQFPAGGGVRLENVSNLLTDTGTYTVAILFRFDAVSSYRKILDFKSRAQDSGFYCLNGNAMFYSPSHGGTEAPIGPGQYVKVVLVRDGMTNEVRAYVNGVEQFTFVDSTNSAVVNQNDRLIFFQDDTATSGREVSAGAVARIQLFDRALSALEIANLH